MPIEPETDEQPKPRFPKVTYEENVRYILEKKLTHKKAGNDSWFAYRTFEYEICFCDEIGKEMIRVKFYELDLNEWYPYKKPFDRDRFERLFCAVLASGQCMNIEEEIEQASIYLKQLDAFYAEKEKGGSNG